MARVFDLNKLSQNRSLSSGSKNQGIVKQDLLKTGHFNVAVISIEASQEIQPHPEPYGVCFYVIDGKGTFTVSNEQIDLARGQMMFAAANEVRGIISKEKLTLLGIQDPH